MKTKHVCRGVMAFVAVFASVQMAHASIQITGGDFNTGYASGANIDGWFSATAGNFWDNAFWDAPGGDPLVNLSINPATVPGDSLSGSWFYQNIGTSDGAASTQIQLDWGDFGGGNSAVRVALYEDTAGTFAQANDLDVEGVLTLVGSQTFTGTPSTDIATFDLSGAGAGNNLYLRINNYDPGTGAMWTYVDNVSVVPEPATIGMIAAAGGVLVMLRRRFLV